MRRGLLVAAGDLQPVGHVVDHGPGRDGGKREPERLDHAHQLGADADLVHAGQVLGQLGRGDIGGDVAGEESGQELAEGALALAAGRIQAKGGRAQAEGPGDLGQGPRAGRLREQAGDDEETVAVVAREQLVVGRWGQRGLSHAGTPS